MSDLNLLHQETSKILEESITQTRHVIGIGKRFLEKPPKENQDGRIGEGHVETDRGTLACVKAERAHSTE